MYYQFVHLVVTEWMLIIDIDEFVYARNRRTIPQYLRKLPSRVGSIVLPWKTFGCAGLLDQPASIISSCRRTETPRSGIRNIKMLTRMASLRSPTSFTLHLSETVGETIITNGKGEKLPQRQPTVVWPFFDGWFPNETQPHALHLNHYQVMSLEYFRKIKMRRGSADQEGNPRTEWYYQQVSEGADAVLDDELARKRGAAFFRALPTIDRTWPPGNSTATRTGRRRHHGRQLSLADRATDVGTAPQYAPKSSPGRSFQSFQRPPPPAAASEVVFLVMSSVELEERAHAMFREPWCRAAQCIFFTEAPFRRRSPQLFNVILPPGPHPSADDCCARGPPDFCTPLWRNKLSAQYRFMPAIRWLKRRIAAAALRPAGGNSSGGIGHGVRWIAMIDDDSYVFLPRFLQLLGWHDPRAEAIYMGDFIIRYPGWKASDFACGGGGSIFSVRALEAMDLDRCISDFSSQCLMSDWMIGLCTAVPYVREAIYRAKEYACDSCLLSFDTFSDKEEIRWRLKNNDCFFMQNVSPDLLEPMPCGGLFGKYAPAIVHGLYASGAKSAALTLADRPCKPGQLHN